MRNKDLGSGAWIVDSGGNEEAAFAVEDESAVVVGDIERFEILFCLRHSYSVLKCYYAKENKYHCQYHLLTIVSQSSFGIGIPQHLLQPCSSASDFSCVVRNRTTVESYRKIGIND